MDSSYSNITFGANSETAPCSKFNFTLEQIDQLAIARGVTSAVGSLACFFTLILIIYHKALKSTLQRMFFYLTASSSVNLAMLSLQGERALRYSYNNDKFCEAAGYLIQYTDTVGLYIKIGAIVYLVHYVRKLSPTYHREHRQHSRKLTISFEVAYITFSILFPLTYIWVPFIHHTYGWAAAWCWISGLNYDDCSENYPEGFWEQMAYGYIPFTLVGTVSTVLIFIMVVKYCQWIREYRTIDMSSNDDRKTLANKLKRKVFETFLLLVHFFVFSLHCATEFTARIILLVDATLFKYYGLWMTYAVSLPLVRLVIPISSLVYLYSFKKAKKQQPPERNYRYQALQNRVPSTTTIAFPREFSDESPHIVSINRRYRPTLNRADEFAHFEESVFEASPSVTTVQHQKEFSDESSYGIIVNTDERYPIKSTVPTSSQYQSTD